MKNKIVLATSFAVAAVLVLGGFIIKLKAEEKTVTGTLKASFYESVLMMQDSIYEIAQSINAASLSVTDSYQTLSLMNARDNAAYLFKALSAMPINNQTVKALKEQAAKINDFALSLIKKKTVGEPLNEDEEALLKELYGLSETLKEKINLLIKEIDEKTLNLSGILGFHKESFSDDALKLEDYLDGWGEEIATFPELNYDGKYGSPLKTEYSFLKNNEPISQEEIIKTGEKLIGAGGQAVKEGELYRYALNDSSALIYQSGEIIYFYKPEAAKEKSISGEEANKIMLNFLNEQGLENMKIIKRSENEKSVYFELCCEQNGVWRYCDKVILTVSLCTGEVTSYNASDYFKNHSENEESFVNEEKEVLKLFEDNFEVLRVKRAVILSAGGNEICCYEVSAKLKEGNFENEISFFINASTLCEEKIEIKE